MLSKIIWDESFSVGHETLDAQHQRLLQILNDLVDRVNDESHEGNLVFHKILNRLAKYALEHFVTEEAILERTNYDELETQQNDHENYKERVTGFLFSASDGILKKYELLEFLLSWWRHHILVKDMRYKMHLLTH